jgi:hypothetical protein
MNDSLDKQVDKLEAKIEEINKVKEKLKKIRTLETYTVEEKVKIFDQFYNMAQRELLEKLNDEDYSDDNDNAHYDWEFIMELLGKDIWAIWNSV